MQKMEEIKIKKFNIDEVDEITLLSVEEAEKIPDSVRACGKWWWLQSPGYNQKFAAVVDDIGGVYENGNFIYFDTNTVRPVFKISNLESDIGEPVRINKTWCTVIDKELVLTDNPICNHKFDSKSNDWENSELKAFVNSDEFKAMI